MISGPRPGPALSAGSILNNNTFLPVDPYRKFRKDESLKSSANACGDADCCALIVSIAIAAMADRMSFFIFGNLNVVLSVGITPAWRGTGRDRRHTAIPMHPPLR